MRVGVQMYTLRDYCGTVKDTAETLKKVRNIGYKVVQISGMAEPKDVKEMKKLLDDNGLYPCSTHIDYNRLLKEVDAAIEEHKILGCEAIICPGIPWELHNKEGYLKVAEEFTKVIKKLKGTGLAFGYHNHGVEFQRYDGKTGLEILLEKCKGMEAEIDTYWVQYGGGDPAYWIEKFSGRCSQLHFKDMGMIDNNQVMPPIGEGNLNWERIIKSAKKAKARYCLVEMDTPTIDAFESLKRSFDFLISMGLKV
ncbi:MAG: sugar phosphate isomerase/epimerase [bacterium]|nr:sugar phosphate isomerase/epimerase [bacterium]